MCNFRNGPNVALTVCNAVKTNVSAYAKTSIKYNVTLLKLCTKIRKFGTYSNN